MELGEGEGEGEGRVWLRHSPPTSHFPLCKLAWSARSSFLSKSEGASVRECASVRERVCVMSAGWAMSCS